MAPIPFVNAFRAYVHQRRLIERGDQLILGVSGGLDSMVLLDVLCALRNQWKLSLIVAHFNHQLRGHESDADETFVRTVAKERGIECYVEHANTQSAAEAARSSVQEVARELRYTFFAKLRTSLGYHRIATAHHADDNAETVLFNLLRGTGVAGLAGIPSKRSDLSVIRPMLFATRSEIREYAIQNHVVYRNDSSNLKKDYTRNFLREEILPRVHEHVNPNVTRTLLRTSELFHHLDLYLRHQAEMLETDILELESDHQLTARRDVFLKQELFMQEYLLARMIKRFAKSEVDYTTVRAMLRISSSETGTSCSITKDIQFYRDRERLILRRTPSVTPFKLRIERNRAYTLDYFSFSTKRSRKAEFVDSPLVEFVDEDQLGEDLILRTWQEGDAFIPLGLKQEKKVSDFLIERKVPIFEKPFVPVLVSNGSIVWICGHRVDERFKVKPDTKNILKLHFEPRAY